MTNILDVKGKRKRKEKGSGSRIRLFSAQFFSSCSCQVRKTQPLHSSCPAHTPPKPHPCSEERSKSNNTSMHIIYALTHPQERTAHCDPDTHIPAHDRCDWWLLGKIYSSAFVDSRVHLHFTGACTFQIARMNSHSRVSSRSLALTHAHSHASVRTHPNRYYSRLNYPCCKTFPSKKRN